MEKKFSAFISASSKEQDRKVIEWFFRILKKYDIEPLFATDIPEPRPPDDKIIDLIQKSDVFVAIITRRDKIEGENSWRGPEWVQNEIGIAVQQKKPLVIFIEQGIDPNQGLGRWRTEYLIFEREKLNQIRPKAKKLIEALKNQAADLAETRKIEEVIIEEPRSSNTLTSVGRTLILHFYGRLDVNLRKIYGVLALISIPPIYLVYDFLYGNKIFGLSGLTISLIILISSMSFISIAEERKCKECGSYFSIMEMPVLASDVNKLPHLTDDRRYRKWICVVCGNSRIKVD